MDFSKVLFPTVSNRKGQGEITIEDFRTLAPKKEVKKADLTFKNGKFSINKSFLESSNILSGFVGVILDDKGYLLKSTTEETFENTIFLKGENPTPTFSSDSLLFVLQKAGVDENSFVYLNYKTSANGWDVYEISNTESENPVIEEDVKKEGPHDPNIQVEEQEVIKEEQSLVVKDPEYIHIKNEENIQFSNEPLENLI